MPTYQYACTESDCGNEFELIQSFTDPSASDCPGCGGRVRKVFSAVGVVFKGSGFYRNDSRSEAGSAGKPTGDSSGKDSAKSDSGSAPSEGSSPSSGVKESGSSSSSPAKDSGSTSSAGSKTSTGSKSSSSGSNSSSGPSSARSSSSSSSSGRAPTPA